MAGKYNDRRGSSAAGTTAPGLGEISAVIATALVLAALAFGVSRLIAGRHRPPQVYVALDGSGSVISAIRKRIIELLDSLVFETLPARSSLAVWEYDRVAQPIFSGTPRESSDLWPVEDWYSRYSTRARGTCPAAALEQMIPRVAEAAHRGQSAVVLVMTDGEDSDPARTAAAVRRLSAIGSLRAVWILPVDTNADFRADLQRSYAPLLPDRLIVSSQFDVSGGMDKLQALLRRDS